MPTQAGYASESQHVHFQLRFRRVVPETSGMAATPTASSTSPTVISSIGTVLTSPSEAARATEIAARFNRSSVHQPASPQNFQMVAVVDSSLTEQIEQTHALIQYPTKSQDTHRWRTPHHSRPTGQSNAFPANLRTASHAPALEGKLPRSRNQDELCFR